MCEAFRGEFRYFAAQSEHLIDIDFQSFGLRSTPDRLKINTQMQIDATPEGRYDYILIGYGLCSRGTAGLTTTILRALTIASPSFWDPRSVILNALKNLQEPITTVPPG